MARLPRLCLPGLPQHIIQRGGNRQACFASQEDFAAYAYWLEKCANKYQVEIHAWVLMTNHVHLLATPETNSGVSKMMQDLGRYYVSYFNRTYQRTGTLWEGRFRSCVVDAEDYLLICQRYIELNPVRAGMVSKPEDYMWSSYRANGIGLSIKLCKPHKVYEALGSSQLERLRAYRALFDGHINENDLNCIRSACNKGLALGNDKFKREIEFLSGRRVTELRRGRKSKHEE